MPPIRRGRLPARARAGRGRPYGRRRRLGLRDANAPRGDDVAVQVPRAVPVPQAVPVPTVDPVPPVVPERGHDMGVQPDAMPGGVEARRLENLITESIAKGVELGIAKALSAIEARPASVNPVTAERPITVAGLSSSSVPAHPTFTMGSADHSVPAVMASLTAVREQPSASSTSDVSNVVHSITASSLPPQIPGRPGLDATIRAKALDHLVPQKIKDKIWAREYVELSNLLQDEDQEMELKITSHSSNPTFTLVPKNKKEMNTIGKWIKGSIVSRRSTLGGGRTRCPASSSTWRWSLVWQTTMLVGGCMIGASVSFMRTGWKVSAKST